MTNLAIECSGTAGSVALFDGDICIAYADLDPKIGSVKTLAGAIESIVRTHDQPKYLSVTNGPGSFTGLRVGLTTAKMLALAWNIPVVPVDTLQATALRAFGAVCSEWADGESVAALFISVINAYRGQVFANAVRFNTFGELVVAANSTVLDAPLWLSDPVGSLGLLTERPTQVWISGPGLSSYTLPSGTLPSEKLPSEKLPDSHTSVLAPDVWQPTAREVGMLGNRGMAAGKATSSLLLQPNYIRASAAEEKRPQLKS